MQGYFRSIWLCLFLLLLAIPVQANIGDNLDKLRTRYGSAMGVTSPYLFQHDGFSICVYFDGDQSAMEVFMRDSSLPEKKDFSSDELKKILNAENEGHIWNSFASTGGHPVWVRDDNKLIATFNPDQKILTIMVNTK